MFNATVRRIRTPAFKLTKICKSKDCHSVLYMIPHGRRFLSTSSCLYGKILPRKKPRVVPEIAGLEPITYADRMHFVPGLAKPWFPPWDRGWKDPTHYTSPKLEDMPLHKDKPCYMFNQRTNVLEGSDSFYLCVVVGENLSCLIFLCHDNSEYIYKLWFDMCVTADNIGLWSVCRCSTSPLAQ